jgi:hypothetical protein
MPAKRERERESEHRRRGERERSPSEHTYKRKKNANEVYLLFGATPTRASYLTLGLSVSLSCRGRVPGGIRRGGERGAFPERCLRQLSTKCGIVL